MSRTNPQLNLRIPQVLLDQVKLTSRITNLSATSLVTHLLEEYFINNNQLKPEDRTVVLDSDTLKKLTALGNRIRYPKTEKQAADEEKHLMDELTTHLQTIDNSIVRSREIQAQLVSLANQRKKK